MTDGKVAIGAYEYDPANHYFAISATFPKSLVAPATVTLDSNVSGYVRRPSTGIWMAMESRTR